MITAVLVFARRMAGGLERQIFALAYGVLVAGIAQAAYQLPTLYRTGFRFRWVTPCGHESVRTVGAQDDSGHGRGSGIPDQTCW